MADVTRSLEVTDLLAARGEFTPDMSKLRRKENILLFLYDDYKKNMKDNRYIEKHGKFLGRARTHVDQYRLVSYEKNYPVLLEEQEPAKKGYVFGELFAVPPEVIIILDEIKRNGKVFNRISRPVLCLEQNSVTLDGKKPYVFSHMYVGDKPFWEGLSLISESSYFNADSKGRRRRYYEYYHTPFRENLLDGWDSNEERWSNVY